MLTVKLLQTTQKIEILGSESQVYKKWQTAAMIREIFNSNVETGRNGPESGVSQIVRESWQHCHCRGKLGRVGRSTGLGQVSLRCEQALQFGQAKRASLFFARLTWLAQIGELARMLRTSCFFLEFNMTTVTLAETIRTPEENTCNTGHFYLFFFSL